MPSPLPASSPPPSARRHAALAGGGAPPYLVVAASGRALALSALRGGHRCVVFDYFADADTLAAGVPVRRIAAAHALRVEPARLLAAAAELPAHACAGLVYGSCFDDCPALLAELARGRPLWGNAPEVLEAAKEPRRFFALLDALGIPHPETRLARPRRPEGWLVKRVGGSGGDHVLPLAAWDGRGNCYFQRAHAGLSCSLLFLADGRRARAVAWNEHVPAQHPELPPHLFAGLLAGARPAPAVAARIAAHADALVAALGLVGLNGIDFLLREDGYAVLELNPRPTAALELYDADWPEGLFAEHLRACRGRLPERLPAGGALRGYALVYARQAGRLRRRLPLWCRDLPVAGARFERGDPVCSVHARAARPAALRRLLGARRAAVECMLAAEAA